MFSSITSTTTSSLLFLSLLLLQVQARHPASLNSPRSASSEDDQHRERPAHIYQQDPNDHISALNLNFLPFLKKAASLYTSNPNPSSSGRSSNEKKTGRRSSTEKKRTSGKVELSKEEGRMLLQSGLMESVNVKGRGEGGREVVGRSRGGL